MQKKAKKNKFQKYYKALCSWILCYMFSQKKKMRKQDLFSGAQKSPY